MKSVAKLIAIACTPLLLAACGNSDDNLLVEMCMKDGNDSQSVCECQVKTLMGALSDEHQEMMISMARLQKEKGLDENDAQMELMSFGLAVDGPMSKAESECRS
ncbi:MAG: hypothetical protein O2910_02485 [Proteobacteria bacterium]|nr:hypothetical protein [Pseudomonadota bacterium]